ncbi:ATP-binding protein [Paenibacillus sp. MBLB4367]|uniref:ATP-binding protein n=1 Tax=Paenibacillus sp. MBLB4367 TaxID=3384767 RepID=UPI00390817DB
METDESRQAEWQIESIYGQEKTITEQIRETVQEMHEAADRIEDMATAVSEACLNAIEHAHANVSGKRVRVTMTASDETIVFRIYDEGQGIGLPNGKLGGADPWDSENPRGWGLFLIASLADEYRVGAEDGQSYMEIQFQRSVKGDRDGRIV